MDRHLPVHVQVLEAARRVADRQGRFRLRDVVAALPHLNPGTVRTHVCSRCCVDAPSHHQSRWPYFRAADRGVYQLQGSRTRTRRRTRATRAPRSWQERYLDSTDYGVDPTLIAESLKRTPTERLEIMRAAAISLEEMRASARQLSRR